VSSYWKFILPVRRPEAESIAAAAISGQPAPGEPSLTRSCASTAGGTREATLPP
jgi:hypothetical protein